jgi:hypothetical protein
MVSAIKNAVADLQSIQTYAAGFGLGTQLDLGLAAGIAAEGGTAATAAGSMVAKTISAAYAHAHGSPEYATYHIGEGLARDLGAGMTAETPSAVAAATSAVHSVVGAMGASASASPAAAAGSSSSGSAGSGDLHVTVEIGGQNVGTAILPQIRALLLQQKRGTPVLGLS